MQYAIVDVKKKIQGDGACFYPLIAYEDAPIKGNCTSLGVYQAEEYPAPGVHEDNEGFYVIEGNGKAFIGDEEIDLCPGMSFYAPAGVPHTIKKNTGSVDVKIFLYHFPK